MLARLRKGFEQLLEAIVVLLMASLTGIIVAAVIYRKAGASLGWYDEVASVLMAWLTYYGAALGALKRAHIGFPGLMNAMRPSRRIPFLIIGEACIFGFFILVAWMGVHVLRVLGGDTLISLPQVPTRLTQSVIPIGAVLFLIAEALSLPTLWRQVKSPGGFLDDELSTDDIGDQPVSKPKAADR
jgi:TRAP-type C4-dicarboxylate transport system permease small subunit